MARLKNVPFFVWWTIFWVVLFTVVLFWDRPMLEIVGPVVVVAIAGYAFYATLVTKPKPDSEAKTETTNPGSSNN